MIDVHDFIDQGYFIKTFDDLTGLQTIKEICEQECQNLSSDFTALENYHLLNIGDDEHHKFQYMLFEKLNALQLHADFVKANLPFFQSLIGPDIDIQSGLYLRIARPNRSYDNIGLHRDTDYGNSAYEVSLSLPLVNQVEGTGLRILPKSHTDYRHRFEQVKRQDVNRGDDKNKMGFLYAPKVPQNLCHEKVKCIDINYGQGLGFTLGLVHGQEQNTSNITRWSIDFRFRNSFHPMNKNLKQGYYKPLVSGPVRSIGDQYYQNNHEEVESLFLSGAR